MANSIAPQRPGALRVAAAPFKAVGRAARHAASYAGAAFTFGGRWATEKVSLVPYYLANLLWLLSEKFLDLSRQGYGGNPAVYSCLRLLSQSVPEPPLLAYLVDKATRQETLLPYDHPLNKLIRNPNPMVTQYEMWELTTLHCGIGGRSTWWKERNNLGDVIALWPLRPDRVGPIYTTETTPQNPCIIGWSYLVPGTVHYAALRRQDVFFTNWPDPAGDSGGLVEGLGPLQVLASEVGADNEATRFVGALLANHAIPGAVIQVPHAIPDQQTADMIKAAFNREFGGQRRGSAAIIDAGSKITQMGFDLQQLEFPSLRKHTESRICACFGVPAILVGMQVGLESGVRATIAEQREYFADTTLSNYWRRFADAFTRDVASEYDGEIVCKFDITKVKAFALQSNREIEKIQEGFKAGAVSYNELRTKVLGLPPLPVGGDRRVLPRGTIEVDENGLVVEAAGVPAAAAGQLPASPSETHQYDTMDDVSGTTFPSDEYTPGTRPSANGARPKEPAHA